MASEAQEDEEEEDTGPQLGTVGDHTGVDWMPKLDFEERWGNPLESEHTELTEVPEEATVQFPGREVTGVTYELFIKRAILDPEATVLPNGNE